MVNWHSRLLNALRLKVVVGTIVTLVALHYLVGSTFERLHETSGIKRLLLNQMKNPRTGLNSTTVRTLLDSATLSDTSSPLYGPTGQNARTSTFFSKARETSSTQDRPGISILFQNLGPTTMPPTSMSTSSGSRLSKNSTQPETRAFSEAASSRETKTSSNLPACPAIPPNLTGPVELTTIQSSEVTLQAKLSHLGLQPGGHFQPKRCQSRHRVAVIVPYRERPKHLALFVENMHNLLSKQELDYAIYFVEPVANHTFNRAKLFNVGYVEALKDYAWQCFVFSDVDLLPEDDRNLYNCPEQPRHMSVAIDLYHYRLPYPDIFGGVGALTKAMMSKVNGFSNDFWGYGGEDDEMASRLKLNGYTVVRYPEHIARYKMVKHVHETKTNPLNPCRYQLIYAAASRWQRDGLNSLRYELIEKNRTSLYTKLLVDLLERTEKPKLAREKICTAAQEIYNVVASMQEKRSTSLA